MTAARFRALHEAADTFIMPNPWDIGSARILAAMGFQALGTTSAGAAFSKGVADGALSIEDLLDHCREILSSTSLPVSADLERGFGDSPESAARTIGAADAIGLAGASLEDHTGDRAKPIYEFELAVDRIAAAAEARDELDANIVLTARAENHLWDRHDLDDTIRRLQAFEAAGADVLYAPGLRDIEAVQQVCAAVEKPVNVIIGGAGFSLSALQDAGAKRISTGSGLARAVMGAFIRAAAEMSEHGTFEFADDAAGFDTIEELLAKGAL